MISFSISSESSIRLDLILKLPIVEVENRSEMYTSSCSSRRSASIIKSVGKKLQLQLATL